MFTWKSRSAAAGRPWFACLDEVNPANVGLAPDDADDAPANHLKNRRALWASLLAGGSGAEWYFGYDRPHNDLTCEDFRSRADAWRWSAVARDFARRVGLAAFAPAPGLCDEPGVYVMTETAYDPPTDDRREAYRTFHDPGGRVRRAVGEGRTRGPVRPAVGPRRRVLLRQPRAGVYPGRRAAADPVAKPPLGGSIVGVGPIARPVRWFDVEAGGGWQSGSKETVQTPAAVDPGAPPGGDRSRDWVVMIGG